MTPLTADDDKSREQQNKLGPPLYCAECGRRLQRGYLIRGIDGELESPGFFPCPDHPHGQVTEKKTR